MFLSLEKFVFIVDLCRKKISVKYLTLNCIHRWVPMLPINIFWKNIRFTMILRSIGKVEQGKQWHKNVPIIANWFTFQQLHFSKLLLLCFRMYDLFTLNNVITFQSTCLIIYCYYAKTKIRILFFVLECWLWLFSGLRYKHVIDPPGWRQIGGHYFQVMLRSLFQSVHLSDNRIVYNTKDGAWWVILNSVSCCKFFEAYRWEALNYKC